MKTQWGFFLKTHLPSGHDTYRFTLWEIRNLLIASNILKVVPPVGEGKVLVIIGAAHKPFLDEYLRQLPDVRIVQLEELLR
jgi:pheromone shutdown protein TraB